MPAVVPTPVFDITTLSARHWKRDEAYRNWRPTGTRDHLLIYTLSGAGRVGPGDQTRVTRAGDWFLFYPGVPQNYRTALREDRPTGVWELIWVHVHPRADWAPYLDWPDRSEGFAYVYLDDLTVRRRVERCLKQVVAHSISADPLGTDLAMNALEAALLFAARARLDPAEAVRIDPRLRHVVDLIHRRSDEPWTIAQLAAHAPLSPSRFAHLFREQLGVTPLQYLEAYRLQRARQLLETTGLGVAQIAEAVGFADAFYFSRRFKAAVGQSPRAYRQTAADAGR
ncbi:MAG: helix-turn-helix domain-containing protein [Planctomycetota bacterium]